MDIYELINDALGKSPLNPTDLPVRPELLKVIRVEGLNRYCSLWQAQDQSTLVVFVHVAPNTRRTETGDPVAAGYYPIVWASLK